MHTLRAWKIHICLMVLFCVLFTPVAVVAESVTAVVPTPPPDSSPTIESPTAGMTAAQKKIPIKGACQVGLIVRTFSNALFGGSTICKTDSTYDLEIDLQEGQNDIIAKQYDTLNQPSPDSETVTVYYVSPQSAPALPGETPSEATAHIAKFALKVEYEYTLQNPFIGQTFRLPIRFIGGTAPYAVSVEWGDGQSTLLSREDAGQFLAEHAYQKSGTYIIKVRISDHDGEEAFLQFALLVNGSRDSVVVKTPFGDVGGPVAALTLTGIGIAVGVPSVFSGLLLGRYIWKIRTIRALKNVKKIT